MKYFSRDEVEKIGMAGSMMIPGLIPQYRYLSSFWLCCEPNDQAFTPHGLTGYWESWITCWLSQQFDEHDMFIDIGANVGYYTLMAAKHGIPTFSFEPIPHVYRLLRHSISANRVGTVLTYPIALGDKYEKAHLSVPENHSGGAHIDPDGNIEVEVRPLDHFSDSIRDRTLIKIDAEGYEPQILAGMEKIFSRPKITIVAEWDSVRWPNVADIAADLYGRFNLGVVNYDGTESKIGGPGELVNLVGIQNITIRNY